ncbi:MAG: uroporphyrinogen decarboxylase family protein [Armatimonadota bacterium]
MTDVSAQDGVHAPVPRERMTESARKLRDIYAVTPGAPILHREFGFMEGVQERWQSEGMPPDVPMHELFHYDPPGDYSLGALGWCEAEFWPCWDPKVVEDRGDYEVVQDHAGRKLLCFKGRRQGFMPEYLDHPVRDMDTWERGVKWRLDPTTPERYADLDERMARAKTAAAEGRLMVQNVAGGYMYLRSLIGPTELLFAFYDQPALIHECMKAWFELADAVTASHQEHVTIEMVYFGEDICYNKGPLISPEMVREFLFPYYRQLLANVKERNIDQSRRVMFQLDTDGYAPSVIALYREIGMDAMLPFEVASGCDVVEIGKQWPDLVIGGGIDKRVLATDPKTIDAYLERVIPAMRARGGCIPTSDHAVPLEVSYANYLHYRRRCVELGG